MARRNHRKREAMLHDPRSHLVRAVEESTPGTVVESWTIRDSIQLVLMLACMVVFIWIFSMEVYS